MDFQLVFEFTHTNAKAEEKKKEVAGPIAPPSHRQTTNPLKKQDSASQKEAVAQSHPLFAAKSQARNIEEEKDEDDYEEVNQSVRQQTSHTPMKTGSHKGLLVHFESRCQTKMVIPTRLSELETA